MKRPYHILLAALAFMTASLQDISGAPAGPSNVDISVGGRQAVLPEGGQMDTQGPSGITETARTDGLSISGTAVSRGDSTLRLSFDIAVTRKAVHKGSTVVYIPEISDGEHTVSFAPVVVRGKRSQTAWERREWAVRETAAYDNAVCLKPGETTRYHSEIPWQYWMDEARFSAEIVAAGCCSTMHESVELFPQRALPSPEPAADPLPITGGDTQPDQPLETVTVPELTVADSIAEVLPFVLPAAEFDPENPVRLYDDERDNAIIIYYHINSYEIEPGYAGNRQTLANLLASIDMILNSAVSGINRVTVAGFASPDGPFELNDRLAWERAVSVKEYIMKNSGLPDELISLYNGSADWQGLRLMVSSDPAMPHREEVLDIIDNTPVWDPESNTGRNGILRRLYDGEPYRYMAQHIFPKLRNGAFIRVYYDNYPK